MGENDRVKVTALCDHSDAVYAEASQIQIASQWRINMNRDMELARLTKENDNFKKIIETQQTTINRMIDYFILELQDPKKNKQC